MQLVVKSSSHRAPVGTKRFLNQKIAREETTARYSTANGSHNYLFVEVNFLLYI